MRQLLYLLCAAALLTACQKQDGESKIPQKIQFRAFIQEGDQISPIAASASRAMAGDLAEGYYLNAPLTTQDYPVSGASAYDMLMHNVEMNPDGSYKSASEKKYFWAEGNPEYRHSFLAYSANPAGTTAGDGVNSASLSVEDGQLQVSYLNPDDPAKQIDLLTSESVTNLRVGTVGTFASFVDLVFKHRLSRVMVKIINTGGATLTKCQAQILYTASAVQNKADIPLLHASVPTFANNHHAGTYNLGSPFTLSGSANSLATAIEVGDMILLPGQSLPDGWATLTLSYTPDGENTPQTTSANLPAISLTAGKQYEILVNIIAESPILSVSAVTLSPWATQTGTIDKL